MAKVVAEYDTVDKSLSVKHDGKKVDNLKNLSFDCNSMDGGDQYSMGMHSHSHDAEHDVHTRHSLYASECDKNKVVEKIRKYLAGL